MRKLSARTYRHEELWLLTMASFSKLAMERRAQRLRSTRCRLSHQVQPQDACANRSNAPSPSPACNGERQQWKHATCPHAQPLRAFRLLPINDDVGIPASRPDAKFCRYGHLHVHLPPIPYRSKV